MRTHRVQNSLTQDTGPIVAEAARLAHPLREPKDLTSLVERIKDRRIVMLGESSHGTQEFYEWRRMLSEWLIVKHGFNFIAVEGDWPPCRDLDQYVRHGVGGSARAALSSFKRWPTWMWANTAVVRLVDWLRERNRILADEGNPARVGFHGLDVYSLFDSMSETIRSLEKINPFLARKARQRYSCFDPYAGDEIAYARSLRSLPQGCTEEVAAMLGDLLKSRFDGTDELFDATQNARIVANAERYYRTMIHADEASWNVRDEHMMETLELLLQRYGPQAKAVVWAHNTHIGDHNHTDMRDRGLVNLGGLARERFGKEQVALIGFGTHSGSVIASHAWDGPIEVKWIPEGREGSVEAAFHETARQMESICFHLWMDERARAGALANWYSHRAIGVVYEPEHERGGNYVPSQVALRYDGFVFVDRTRALEPIIQAFDRRELPETWPVGQ
jgi:erythromycin esterase